MRFMPGCCVSPGCLLEGGRWFCGVVLLHRLCCNRMWCAHALLPACNAADCYTSARYSVVLGGEQLRQQASFFPTHAHVSCPFAALPSSGCCTMVNCPLPTNGSYNTPIPNCGLWYMPGISRYLKLSSIDYSCALPQAGSPRRALSRHSLPSAIKHQPQLSIPHGLSRVGYIP